MANCTDHFLKPLPYLWPKSVILPPSLKPEKVPVGCFFLKKKSQFKTRVQKPILLMTKIAKINTLFYMTKWLKTMPFGGGGRGAHIPIYTVAYIKELPSPIPPPPLTGSDTKTFSALQKNCESNVLPSVIKLKKGIMFCCFRYSCTAFAYGQTGSGKTYTITGPLNLVRVCPGLR